MTGVLNKLAGSRVAIRRLCIALALALVSTLALDLHHHALHAGQGHTGAMAGTAVSGGATSVKAADLSTPSSERQHDRHAVPGVASCDCCAASCFTLLTADLGTLASSSPRPTLAEYVVAAILSLPPSSLDRPPIANL